MTRLLVTGGRGQLGRALVRVGLVRGYEVAAPGADELDITSPIQIHDALVRIRPALVINAAAYTGVDRAETERPRAFAVNADGVGLLARACAAYEIPMIQVSTDHVFGGTATRPYREDDPPRPVNVYGASKLAGERAVLGEGGIVVRTAWLFGDGGPSFVHAIAHAARTQPSLRVVDDQVGCPTWADDLAGVLLALGDGGEWGTIYHACGEGAVSRYAFARAIVDELDARCEVIPVATSELAAAARRPAYAVLDTSRLASLGIVLPPWRGGLREVIARMS